MTIDEREYLPYIIINPEFQVTRVSQLLRQYIPEFALVDLGEDARNSIPELTGLEKICEEILSEEQDNFVLNSVAREQLDGKLIYFDIRFHKLDEKLILFFLDTTELIKLRQSYIQKANEAELALSTLQRFEYCTNKIINSMEDILLITNSEGLIERVNSAAEKILNLHKTELIDFSLSEIFIHPELSNPNFYQSICKNSKIVRKLEVCFLSKVQEEIEIEFNCFRAPTEIPQIYNCVLIGRDITIRKRAEREMLAMVEKEKELRILKSRFLSMASHEFRNPLSSILVCTDLLAQDDENRLPMTEQNFYLQLIKDSALNIKSILENILVLSKAEAGKQKLIISNFDLPDFCRQIIRELQINYPERIIDLQVPAQKFDFEGDQKLLWHIFTNLLSNALKYSPYQTQVDFKVELNSLSATVKVEICDRGIGIPQEAQKYLFDSFYRAGNVGEVAGTGLGLAIVKRSVELQQGSISIASAENVGTTIELEFPQHPRVS